MSGIDRMYLNLYIPRLQIIEGVLGFMKNHLGHKVASTKLVEPITRRFVAAIEQFVQDHAIPMIFFNKGQRKDEVAARFRADFSTHKEGRALRTETTINNAEDFYVGKRLHILPALRCIGFRANRRLLEVEKITHDCILAEEASQQINRPRQVASQRASALRFGDPKVQALWSALLVFTWLPTGFCNRDLREHFASLLGRTVQELGRNQMTYQLRRLRLHGIIERIPQSHRYRVTDSGLRTALFFTRI